MSQLNTLEGAARLLVDIAGSEPVHIEMSARGPRKYYDVHRALTERDARAHLAGYTTCGATLRHPQGMTRALCYDADTPGDWLLLVEAAYWLAAGGYRPLLEESPVGRGGHLWIIYTALVKANWAHRHAAEIASSLKQISESWPGAGGHKVRLPGGLYVRPEVRAWCKLYDAQGRLLSADGQEAARVLQDWHTSAELVPNHADAEHEHETSEHAVSGNALLGYMTVPMPGTRDQDKLGQGHSTRGADRRWHEKYGRYFWFQFTPDQLAAWYNAHTRVQDVLPPGKNGMGLASWRGERTASVGLREGGWVDFGASARRADGKQDGGDALELTIRVTEQPKPEVMRQLARQLVREAREAMERAARHGEGPPEWVVAIMTEAGWERYHALRAEAGYVVDQTQSAPEADQVPQSTRGVAGFYLPPETVQGDTKLPGEEVRQRQKTVSAVPHEANRGRETPQRLSAAMGVELGVPCPRCGCPLRYPLEPYLMCYKCHPPRGLADEHWRQLCALFPLRRSLQGR